MSKQNILPIPQTWGKTCITWTSPLASPFVLNSIAESVSYRISSRSTNNDLLMNMLEVTIVPYNVQDINSQLNTSSCGIFLSPFNSEAKTVPNPHINDISPSYPSNTHPNICIADDLITQSSVYTTIHQNRNQHTPLKRFLHPDNLTHRIKRTRTWDVIWFH